MTLETLSSPLSGYLLLIAGPVSQNFIMLPAQTIELGICPGSLRSKARIR